MGRRAGLIGGPQLVGAASGSGCAIADVTAESATVCRPGLLGTGPVSLGPGVICARPFDPRRTVRRIVVASPTATGVYVPAAGGGIHHRGPERPRYPTPVPCRFGARREHAWSSVDTSSSGCELRRSGSGWLA